MKRLEGQVAIVTGGARGLGEAFSMALAGAGAAVVIADILVEEAERTAARIAERGGAAIAIKADVTSEEDTIRMAGRALEQFGRMDILVNNAAMLQGITRKEFTEIPVTEWDRLMSVNLKGCFLCSRAVVPLMKKQGRGKIINISSASVFSGSAHFLHYVTSKAGTIGFTRALAVELGVYHICVNAVAPGFTDTETTRAMKEDIKDRIAGTPMGRLGSPGDMTGAVIFLAGRESDFITGQTLVVDGGRYMH
jgi:3-oxoacyl-[acyl-carrier protein] reductase